MKNTVLKPTKTSTEIPITRYINFLSINFPFFLPCSFPVLLIIERYIEADV